MVEEQIYRLIESIDVDARMNDDLFWFLIGQLGRVSQDEETVSRIVSTRLIDFFVPDDPEMLYLLLTPNAPLLYHLRLDSKPYDFGVVEKRGSHYLNFDVIYKILAESSIEYQPLTIFVANNSIAPLVKHFHAGRYDLPEGSRMVTFTDHLALPPFSKECEQIFGIPPIISFYRPSGMVSYCCRTSDQGFQLPAWVRAFEENEQIDFVDLATFSARGMIHSANVGFVEDRYLRV